MKFIVEVTRIGYRTKRVEVEAKDWHDAKVLATRGAPCLDFPAEHDYEYAAQGVFEVVEEKVA